MRQSSILVSIVLLVQAYAAPQFITFKEGKLGVNFGGYHAGVGLGGLLGGGGTAGGLFAEAGTPFGQAAKAGLGGSVDGSSGTSGGLYAGATAGGDVKAAAGLGGAVAADRAAGAGYATASGGHNTGLHGESGFAGSSGLSFSAHKSINIPTVVKETEVSVVPIKEVKYEAANEIKPVEAHAVAGASVNVKSEAPTVIVKEVYVEPPPPHVIEKTVYRTHKPHRHHLRKTAYIGGYVGAGADVAAAQPAVVKTVQPVIEKRVDVGTEAQVNGGVGAYHGGAGDVTYTKRVSVANNPTFFQDIFNIPISTLKAVNSFLTNAASGTKVSVEKTASIQGSASGAVHAGAGAEDVISAKHVAPSSVSSSSEAHISVQTPSASSFIDDIFSIPINTLSAVNKFLENNAARKRVQVSAESSGEPTKIRLGPHARRRANKQVVIIEEPVTPESHDALN